MRTIKKLTHYQNRQLDRETTRDKPQSAQEATKRWQRFNQSTLLKQLLSEQFGLCAYTELNIQDFSAENYSDKGAHIEHLAPKNKSPQRTFDYHNLVLSALDSNDLTTFKKNDRFGGHFKLQNYDADLFISPLDPTCRDHFSYSTENGEIFPNLLLDNLALKKAQYTINLLNLNTSYLKNSRKLLLQELEQEIHKLLDSGSQQGLEKLADCELCTTAREHPLLNSHKIDQLRAFHSASRQLFGPLADKVINSNCPACL